MVGRPSFEGIAKGALKLPSQPLLISFLELSLKFEIIYFPLDVLFPIFQMFREINHEIINLFENKHFKKCGGLSLLIEGIEVAGIEPASRAFTRLLVLQDILVPNPSDCRLVRHLSLGRQVVLQDLPCTSQE